MLEKERQKRLSQIQRVLFFTFLLNLSVCVLKIVLGILTGIFAITADGLHSLIDSASNVIGFFGIRLARRTPDEKYAYGYDKFEPIATLLMVSLISITCYKVLEVGFLKLLHQQPVSLHPIVFVIMILSVGINIFIIRYEGGAGKRLGSQLLIADASETKSDLWISGGVLLGIFMIKKTGWWRLDGLVTIFIGLIILRVIWNIIIPTARHLADGQVIDPQEVAGVVQSIPGAEFCHAVRSRGHKDGFYLDFHLGVDKSITVEKAHDDVCHRVKKVLYENFPGLKSANIHIEPNSDSARTRANSVFRESDPYGHAQHIKHK